MKLYRVRLETEVAQGAGAMSRELVYVAREESFGSQSYRRELVAEGWRVVWTGGHLRLSKLRNDSTLMEIDEARSRMESIKLEGARNVRLVKTRIYRRVK